MTAVVRRLRVYTALAAIAPKLYLAYSAWFWLELIVQIIALVIFVFFWRSVYASQTILGGLELRDTLNYILLAQVFAPVASNNLVFYFGELLHDGQMGIELLRPMDIQARFYVEDVTFMVISLIQKIPLAIFAWLVFDLALPADALTWAAFAFTLFLGHAIIFCFNYLIASLAFYTTEAWGLGMMQFSIATFFSGSLVPLEIMPGWLQTLTLSMPFAQALYVPVSLLSGITPLTEMPRLWLIQSIWLVGLFLASRFIFRIAVRKLTVQGG